MQKLNFFAKYGPRRVNPWLPVPTVFNKVPSPYIVDIYDYHHAMIKHLYNAWGLAQQNVLEAQQKQKPYYDKKANPLELQLGDSVWVHNPAVPQGMSPKFHKPWTGPYRVIGTDNYPVIELSPLNDPGTKV